MAITTAARFSWPWQDRQGRFSPLRAGAWAAVLLPAVSMLSDLTIGFYGDMPVHGFLYWSGVWATALLLLVLAVTPARTILRWNRLIAVRRIIGLAALAYTVFHVFMYFALDSWNFAQVGSEMAVMSVNVIAATVSTVFLVALGATSYDAAVRRLGPKGWQRLHRLAYAATVLAIVHFLLSRGVFPVVYVFSGILLWLLAWRVLARFGRGADPVALGALTVAVSLVTLALEAWWTWAHHGFDPLRTLADNFTLEYGLTSAWQILVSGLIVTALAALIRLRTRTPSVSHVARTN